MATSGYRTIRKLLGRAGSGTQGTSGIRGVLTALAADMNDLRAHTHRYNGANAGVDSTSTPKSDAGGVDATGGTAITITSYTIQ